MLKRRLKYLKRKFLYNFKRHVWGQWLAGRFTKPLHFLKIAVKHRFFGYPYLSLVETTNICNLQCPTCTTPRHLLGREPRIMTLDEFKRVIDRIKNYVHVVLLYDTNEPLTNPQIAEMIEYCDKNNLFTSISTNAALLTKERADRILDAGLDEILLCFDGMSKASYEPFRAGADFETVKENISYFCKEKNRRGLARPYLELQFILTKLNQGEVEEVRKFAKEIGADRLRIKRWSLGEYAYSKDEVRTLAERFLPMTEKKTKYDLADDGTLSLCRERGPEWSCKQAKTQVCVLADGRVSICCYDIKGHHIYGNLHEKTMDEIWADKNCRAMREAAKSGKFPLCDICGEY